MEDIFEANKTLLETTRKLISKLKEVKTERDNLKNSSTLTEEQKREIEQLLIETKTILEEN